MSLPFEKVVLATTNKKKLLELRHLLEPLGLELRSLDQFTNAADVDETGTTFLENARLKAITQAKQLGWWAIGEDSGLVVPALDGAPGIYSARYSGVGATDARNNELLLTNMEQFKGAQRDAHYVSTIALADPEGNIHVEADGQCWGRILRAGRGSAGFGYDPLFELLEYHQTFAELGAAVKAVLSHRARALEKFKRSLLRL